VSGAGLRYEQPRGRDLYVSGLFDGTFARGGAAAAVSDAAWFRALLEVEAALARAAAGLGLVPGTAADAVTAACADPARLDLATVVAKAADAGNPVPPLVRVLQDAVGERDAVAVHVGATSQDILDTAMMVLARNAVSAIDADLAAAAAAAAQLAERHRDDVVMGRTLMQQALPTTFGLKAAGWLDGLLDARARLRDLRAGLSAQLGGAAGTLSALGDRGPELAALYAAELDLQEPTLPWHANRVRIAELGAALGIASGVTAKIALDLELLAQTEVGEVREGEGGASSAMPHKQNPVAATLARACAALTSGHASVLRASLVGEHERAAGAWQAEWDALSGALATAGGSAAALAEALEGLEVDGGRMRANLELTRGGIVAERVAVLLAERLGRQASRSLVREASASAAASGSSLGDELAGLDGGLTDDELAAALDPATYLGAAGAFVDRALARYAEEGA
jgi:3-carboxy-cis,cis-muconate cycloisomerase